MPELRRDPVLGRWVIIATDRIKRPHDFGAEATLPNGKSCAFCEGREDMTPPEISVYRAPDSRSNGPGWRVRTVPNKYPALQVEGELDRRGDGVYDLMNGLGAHEVIIESPSHVTSLTDLEKGRIQEVLWMYRDRMVDLKRDRRLVYGLVFKNVGAAAGASLEHTHSQLICTPIVPKTVAEEMARAGDHFDHRGRCLFCDMVRQELTSYARVIGETGSFVAFAPFAARFPFETWILPKRHASHFEDTPRHEIDELAECLRTTLVRIEHALDRPAYNYLVHSAPFDRAAMESYHWHIEIIPRITRVAGFEWGTDFYINPIAPETAAEYLRRIEVAS